MVSLGQETKYEWLYNVLCQRHVVAINK